MRGVPGNQHPYRDPDDFRRIPALGKVIDVGLATCTTNAVRETEVAA